MAARVLIIEDNATNLELMAYLLHAFGHQPVQATEGLAGVEAAARERPDLIVCDLQMPDADGFEVLRRLRADPATSRIPVVAVTAYAMVGDRERILAAGFDGYIAKPIDPRSFVSQVEAELPPRLHGGRMDARKGREADGRRAVQAREARETRETREARETRETRETRATILAVDNSPPNLLLVRTVLEPAGLRVLEARSVREALAQLESETPDLILCDIHMPEADGWTLLSEVKSAATRALIPFVFLSSTLIDVARFERQAQALGAARLISRPIEPRALLRAIEDCLARPVAGGPEGR
jgi:two-component system, cell cycle response regulator